jgi:DNA-binding beta-propeller fold protein YncE
MRQIPRHARLCTALFASAMLIAPAHAQTGAYHITGHIPGADGGWDYATFDPAARRIYVAKGAAIMAVDADSGKVTPQLTTAQRSHAAVPLPGGRLLVTNGGNDTAVFVDAQTGKALGSVATGKGPDAGIYDPKSGLAFVVAHAGGSVTFIDVAKQEAVATIDLGGTAREFAAVDGAGRLWVNDEGLNEIASVDIKTRKVLGHYKLDGCEGPTGLAYAPAADRLVATCDGVAAVIDPASGKMVDKLTIGAGPDAIFYDPTRKLLFASAGESGELDIISAASSKLKVVQVLKTMVGARTGTVDPKTGKVYLPVAKYGPPVAGSRRPPVLPGTFELLVVGP